MWFVCHRCTRLKPSRKEIKINNIWSFAKQNKCLLSFCYYHWALKYQSVAPKEGLSIHIGKKLPPLLDMLWVFGCYLLTWNSNLFQIGHTSNKVRYIFKCVLCFSAFTEKQPHDKLDFKPKEFWLSQNVISTTSYSYSSSSSCLTLLQVPSLARVEIRTRRKELGHGDCSTYPCLPISGPGGSSFWGWLAWVS